MAEPESREGDEKKREDDSPEPLTLSDPEPVVPAAPEETAADEAPDRRLDEPPAESPWDERRDLDPEAPRVTSDEAEVVAETPPPFVAEPEPETAAAPPPPRRPEPARRSGPPGFFLLLVGGIAGAAGGFAYSRMAKPDWPLADFGQTEQVAALQGEVASLRAELAAQPEPAPAAPAAEATAPTEDLRQAEERAAAAEARVAELEAQLADAPAEAPTAAAAPVDTGPLEAEIAALREQIAQASGAAVNEVQADAEARIAAAEEQAARLKAEVEAAARAATTAAAVAQVRASLDGGVPYADALEELAAKGVEIPMTLITTAEGGVPTLPQLEDSFPAAAREALAVSRRATMGDDWMSRARAFVLTEAGLRSLRPRAGDDPDAVLSRAEAAIRAADLPKALDEIATLPPQGQDAMAGWTAEAEKRIEAIEAAQALAAAAEGK